MKLEKRVKFCSLFTASFVLAIATAAAQDSGMSNPGMQQQPMPNDTRNMPMTDNGQPGMANYAAAGFIKDVFQDDLAQVRMSQLAQQKSTSDDVKQFGEQMVNVHTKLDQQLEPMAKQLGVSQPKGPSKKDKKELEKLQGLSGAEFETEYLKAMADIQQQSIKQFDKESKDSMTPAAQQAAKADGPVLEQNYQVLEKIAQAHNVTLEALAKQ